MTVSNLSALTIQMLPRPGGGFSSFNGGVGAAFETGADSASGSGTVGASPMLWQRPSGFYLPRRFDMVIDSPRPDSETGVTANDTIAKTRASVARPGFRYLYKVRVGWGSRSGVRDKSGLRYELLGQVPAGMVIRQDGWIDWPTASQGRYVLTARVYDQEYQRGLNPSGVAQVTWTLHCDESFFVEMRGGQPVGNYADIHKNSNTDQTYKGRAVWQRGGTYPISAPGGSNELRIENKPKIWIHDPDETVLIDFSAAQYTVGNLDDVWFDNISGINGCTTLDDTHMVFFEGFFQQRCGVHFKKASNIRRGSVATSNPAVVTLFAPDGDAREHFTASCAELTDNTVPFIDAYGIRGTIEDVFGHDNVASAGGEGQLVFAKGGCQDLYITNVVGRNIDGDNAILLLGSSIGDGGVFPQKAIAVAFCDIRLKDSNGTAINTSKESYDKPEIGFRPYWVERCTTYGGIGPWNTFSQDLFIDRCVAISNGDAIPESSGNLRVTATGNITGNVATNIVDSENHLLGAFRANLGQVGVETD